MVADIILAILTGVFCIGLPIGIIIGVTAILMFWAFGLFG